MHLMSCRILVIFITSSGEIFLLLFHCQLFFKYVSLYIYKKKKKRVAKGLFLSCPAFVAGIHFQWIKILRQAVQYKFCGKIDCDQMEHLEGEQYTQYNMERNPRAYMSMRDYRNLPWQWQHPVERNSNPCRFMREYRDQWTSTPSYSVTPTYAPPPHPQYASLSQPQPPHPISLIEQAILDLTKLVGDVVEEQKKFNAQLSQKNHTVENSLDQRLDGLQSEMDKKVDNLHYSISRLAQQLDHQEEESQEEECLSDTMAEEQCQQQPHQELIEDFIELSEGLSKSSYMCDVVLGKTKKKSFPL